MDDDTFAGGAWFSGRIQFGQRQFETFRQTQAILGRRPR
jgi:hypothetical protein